MSQTPPHTPDLVLTSPPFLRAGWSTPRIMGEVALALLPVLAAGCWFFGLGALLVVAASTLGATATEWFFWSRTHGSLRDNSGLLTGVLLGLILPPAFPLWMAFLGGVASIGLGKLVWGGLGQNIFNPALVGRAFLQACFPTAITTWNAPGAFFELPSSLFALPLMQGRIDTLSSATPLGLAKFEQQVTELEPLLLGHISGSIGETSAAVLILCGLWLSARRVFDWRLPISTLLSVAVFSGALNLWKPELYPGPLFQILSGGLLFAAVFMVTDPVTTPASPRGAWIFGIGTGFLVVLIRIFGGLPEGVMYAILLMNALTPHLNRYTQPRRFGG